MFRFASSFDHALTVSVRALMVLLLLVAPVLAVPGGGDAGRARIIEAPASKNSGVGFVLLVSLQRA